jgi:DNA-directed DNA polymerase III PolC
MSPGFQMARCYAFSRKTGIPPVATNRVHLVAKDQFRLHLILRAISLNSKLSRLGPEDTCHEHNFLNSPNTMIDQFPHAPMAVENTIRIAESSLSDWDFDRIIFPCFESMADQDAFDQLYRATMEGCGRRYGKITTAVKKRVEHEMRIIREKNFAHYFLVVSDITKKARRSCGRGSAAASIVSYALGITHVDPIRHNLFFERFLNPARMDPPDIDVDFAWDERDRVIDYVFAKYGNRRAAMVANHNTFGARSAIREVAKVFGLTDREIGRVTDKIGFRWSLGKIGSELSVHPRMKELEFKKPWDEILSAAVQLENHFNHLSTHCGGLVVVPDEIRRYCPVEISASGPQVLQWEKDSVENSGLVKIDILGNRSLAVIRDTLDLVKKNYGRRIDYADLNPIDDSRTIRIFYQGDTFGVFYFESPATRQVLTKLGSVFTFEKYLHTDHFHLNVVVTSIIRPASNRSVETWIARLKGEPWDPPHPLLRPVLEETLGVMVFQEQLSLAAIHLAGFDPAEGEMLRKVVSKKLKEKKLRDFYARFVKGAKDKGVDMKVIEEVWLMMMGFDGYSFCKPHSASYTLVAYKSAYLRAHYPAEFMASVISNGGGYYSTFGYISEARRMGLTILPPDINHSEIKYTGKDKEVRVGLMQLKDLSSGAKETVIHERSKNGPFMSFDNFLDRTGSRIHLQDVRILIKAGCFDGIAGGHVSRPGLMWQALGFLDQKEDKKDSTLFDQTQEPVSIRRCMSPQKPYPKNLMLKHESEILGFLLSVHPLDLCRHVLNGPDYVRAEDLHHFVGKQVTTIGWYITGKTVRTKKDDTMKFVSFEDQTGIYETVLFPNVYNRYCHMLNASRPYILKGKVEENSRAITMTVNRIDFLDRYKENTLFKRKRNKALNNHA